MSEPLVLLPGMMCDARLFGPQMVAFGASRALHVPPIGGFASIEEIARDVLAHAPPKFAVAGLSMGGLVAMEMIAQAPKRVSRLALMDTNAAPEHPKAAEAREPQIRRVMASELRTVMRDEMSPNYLAPGSDRSDILDLVLEMALSQGEGVFLRQSRALQTRPDQREKLGNIEVPTLVLCGAQDALCPVHRHELIAELIPNATLTIIEGAGHLPTLETPEEVNTAMQLWLDSELPPLRLT